MRIRLLLTLIILAFGYSAMAQFTWPEDPEKRKDAQLKWTMFSDTENAGNYDAAKTHLEYILANYPKMSESTYIKGIKIWDETYENSKSEEEKMKAADKVMQLYDMRFENFPPSKNENIGRQANAAYRYFVADPDKTEYLLGLFKSTYELEGNEAFYPIARYYMKTAVLGVARKIDLSDEQLLDIYDKTSRHIDYQMAQAKSKNKSTKSMVAVKDFLDEKLSDLKLIDCEFVENKLLPEFRANPSDIELANKIFTSAYSGGCTDADWFIDVAKAMLDAPDPQYGVANLIASDYVKKKDYTNAKVFYNKAIQITQDNSEKSKAMKQIVTIERLEGNKEAAAKMAEKTAEVDPTMKGDMYTLIGDMIMQSSDCDGKTSQVQDRARFIVAYDYYMKAGNQYKAGEAKAQFPSGGDIFTEGKEVGDAVSVGCWIKKSVNLQKRPDQQ